MEKAKLKAKPFSTLTKDNDLDKTPKRMFESRPVYKFETHR